jgi:hypothetical protein
MPLSQITFTFKGGRKPLVLTRGLIGQRGSAHVVTVRLYTLIALKSSTSLGVLSSGIAVTTPSLSGSLKHFRVRPLDLSATGSQLARVRPRFSKPVLVTSSLMHPDPERPKVSHVDRSGCPGKRQAMPCK